MKGKKEEVCPKAGFFAKCGKPVHCNTCDHCKDHCTCPVAGRCKWSGAFGACYETTVCPRCGKCDKPGHCMCRSGRIVCGAVSGSYHRKRWCTKSGSLCGSCNQCRDHCECSSRREGWRHARCGDTGGNYGKCTKNPTKDGRCGSHQATEDEKEQIRFWRDQAGIDEGMISEKAAQRMKDGIRRWNEKNPPCNESRCFNRKSVCKDCGRCKKKKHCEC